MSALIKILFCPRTSALRDSLGSPRTLHTFANRTSYHSDLNLQKSASFAVFKSQSFDNKKGNTNLRVLNNYPIFVSYEG